MGAIHDALATATTEGERKAIKAQAWVDQGLAQGWNFNYRGYKVTLTAAMAMDSGDVVFHATLSKSGTDYTPPDLNPIRMVNPPFMVEDPGGEIAITFTDVDGNPQVRYATENVLARIVSELQSIGDKVIDAL